MRPAMPALPRFCLCSDASEIEEFKELYEDNDQLLVTSNENLDARGRRGGAFA